MFLEVSFSILGRDDSNVLKNAILGRRWFLKKCDLVASYPETAESFHQAITSSPRAAEVKGVQNAGEGYL